MSNLQTAKYRMFGKMSYKYNYINDNKSNSLFKFLILNVLGSE
jgi:hypothetical protein